MNITNYTPANYFCGKFRNSFVRLDQNLFYLENFFRFEHCSNRIWIVSSNVLCNMCAFIFILLSRMSHTLRVCNTYIYKMKNRLDWPAPPPIKVNSQAHTHTYSRISEIKHNAKQWQWIAENGFLWFGRTWLGLDRSIAACVQILFYKPRNI